MVLRVNLEGPVRLQCERGLPPMPSNRHKAKKAAECDSPPSLMVISGDVGLHHAALWHCRSRFLLRNVSDCTLGGQEHTCY